MMSSANSVLRRYYISISWASRENPQARTKAQGYSSTAKAKKAQHVWTCLTGKFTTLIWMGMGHHKIRRKTLGLCGKKARVGHMIQEEIVAKLEVAMQIEAMAEAECKTGPSTTCSTKETLVPRHPTGTNRRNLLPQINPHTKISTLSQNTNSITIDTPPSITIHITIHRTQAKSTHLSLQSLTLQHAYK
jgi:hypothetical protein